VNMPGILALDYCLVLGDLVLGYEEFLHFFTENGNYSAR